MANKQPAKKTTGKSVAQKTKNATKTTKKVPEKVVDANVEEVTERVDTTISDNSSKRKKTSIGKRIFDIVFWIIIICLAFVWIVDFINVKNGNDPKFCLKTVTHDYEDGTVKECKGLGYNIYSYDRTSKNIKTQFSPFFIGIED